MKILWMILGTLCFIYYFIIIGYAGFQTAFSKVWAFMGLLLFLLAGICVWLDRKEIAVWEMLPHSVRMAGIAVMIAGMLCFVVVEGLIISGMYAKPEADLDYIIVLGAQVKKEIPSKALLKRLVKAEEYLKENPHTIAVLSGGQGSGEAITEAEAMRRYLVENGIQEKRLILEKRSTNTKENMEYSFALIGSMEKKVGIVSNDFHIYRAMAIGKKMGGSHLNGIPADSEAILQVSYLLREFFAVVKDKLVGNL